MWNGSAASVLDLHQYVSALDAGFIASGAFGIGADGSIVGYAIHCASDQEYAVL